MSTLTGSAVAATIRVRLSIASSSGICSPSLKPLAAATDQLPVASARAPAAATALALPGSQMLNSTNGRPGTCRARKAAAFSLSSGMCHLKHTGISHRRWTGRRGQQRAVLDLAADALIPRVATAQLALIEPHLDPGGPQRGANTPRRVRIL